MEQYCIGHFDCFLFVCILTVINAGKKAFELEDRKGGIGLGRFFYKKPPIIYKKLVCEIFAIIKAVFEYTFRF
jgi:hypothetical protein